MPGAAFHSFYWQTPGAPPPPAGGASSEGGHQPWIIGGFWVLAFMLIQRF